MFKRWWKRLWPGVSSAQWLADKAPAAWAFIVGGGVMAYLSAITTWLKPWGPVAWGAIALAGGLFAAVIRAVWVWTTSRVQLNKTSQLAMSRSGVNPLMSDFDRVIIHIQDFYSHYYTINKNKRFKACTILGPSLVYFSGQSAIANSEFKCCQIVIVRQDIPLFGIVAFEDPVFTDCQLCNLTLIMNKESYQFLISKNEDVEKHIPVVNA